MSRVIKFRAWDKERKEMVTKPFVLAPTTPSWGAFNTHMTPELNDKLNAIFIDMAGGDRLAGANDNDLFDWADYYGLMNYEVMQFTGLTDKNGAEIFEGDIVRWIVNNDHSVDAPVGFESGAFYMLSAINQGYGNVYNDWLRGEYEVLGNIYEHAHLLEPKP